MMTAPNAAPKNIATTDPTLLANLGLLPFAIEESAAMPVIVSVRTVVVRSGIASFRTAALRVPIASAVKAIRANGWKECSSKLPRYPMPQNDAANRKATSSRNACAANRICASALARAMIRPPNIAPTRNDKSAVDERAMDSPDTCAVANARSTMFPVMFAVKTRPSDRKLTASTKPVTAVIPCNDTEAHGENDCNRRHGVSNGCAQEVEVCIRVVSELYKSACHSEQEDTRHHRYYRGKTNGGERHPPATRDWSKDTADQQTGYQGASRYSGTSLQSTPSHGMSQHADRDWPAQHTQWCREENTECGDGHARSDNVQP